MIDSSTPGTDCKLMSGFPEEVVRAKQSDCDALKVLAKPLSLKKLARVVAVEKETMMLMNSARACGAPRAVPKALRAVREPLRCRSGATSIEYGLIAAGVGLAIIVAVFALGKSVAETYESVARQLSHYAIGPGDGPPDVPPDVPGRGRRPPDVPPDVPGRGRPGSPNASPAR